MGKETNRNYIQFCLSQSPISTLSYLTGLNTLELKLESSGDMPCGASFCPLAFDHAKGIYTSSNNNVVIQQFLNG
jgi:hypothetical protein